MTGLGISLTVNATVPGLIMLRILKVYKETEPTFEYRTWGNSGPAWTKLRSIMLIKIESGVAMFTIQLIRVVLIILQNDGLYISVGINQIFNVIIQSLVICTFHFLLRLFLGNYTHPHPLASVNGIILS